MKKILIYDVAAEYGGAATILMRFYKQAEQDTENEYVFVLSKCKLNECNNIRIISLEWVKRSWFHRLFCDLFYINKIVNENKIDTIINLQNVAIHTNVDQMVYIQNCIPFTDYLFSFKKDKFLWFYQNIIGGLTKYSIKWADRVVVQSKWMKNAICSQCSYDETKVYIDRVSTPYVFQHRIMTEKTLFFYPANSMSYKNHIVLLKACQQLITNGYDDFEVILTIQKEENKVINDYCSQHHIPVVFVGRLDNDEMARYYRKSILVFPSYLETVGLPLIESQIFDCWVLAADCEYAKEALEYYCKKVFFKPDDENSLARCMKDCICREG